LTSTHSHSFNPISPSVEPLNGQAYINLGAKRGKRKEGIVVKGKMLGALVGFVLGIILAAWLYSFYVSTNPQATDMDKGVILFAGLMILVGLAVVGFQVGEDP